MKKVNLLLVGALIAGLVVGYLINPISKVVGGTVENYPTQFVNGLTAGTNKQFSVTSSGSVKNLTNNGTVSAISTASATYTLTASDICNNSYTLVQPLGAVTTVTLPATSTLYASCLPNVGDFKDMNYQSIGTSTILAAGAGGTLNYSASTTVAASKHALLRFMHDTTNTLDIYMVNVAN